MIRKMISWYKEGRKRSKQAQVEFEEEWAIIKSETMKKEDQKQKIEALLNAIDKSQFSTDKDYKATLKKHLLIPLGNQGEKFQICEVISVDEEKNMWITSSIRFVFLIDDVNKQFVLFDLLPTPKTPAKIYKYDQIIDFTFEELEIMSRGSAYIHAMTINVFINDPDDSESKFKALEPKVIFQVIPRVQLSKLEKHRPRYIAQKEIADQIMASLTYMKNNS